MQPKRIAGPTIFHLELNQGMDQEFKFVYVDDSTLLPIDLTGWKADLYVRLTSGHPQVLKGITSSISGPDGSITLGSSGQINVKIGSSFTTQIPWYDACYDLVLTNPNLQHSKIIRGKVNVYNTITFPLNYSPQGPGPVLVLTIGKTSLPPSEMFLYGYMNPLKMGIGGGLLLTGDLRPTFYEDLEIVELSYSGERLRLVFLGNVIDGTFSKLKLGSMTYDFSTSGGRVFSSGAALGLGLTYWEWTGVLNPFGDQEGSSVIVQFESAVEETIDGGQFE